MLRSTQTIIALLLGLLLSMLAPSLHAQERDSSLETTHSTYGDAVTEILLQGSLDGKSMFMVLGFNDAKRYAGESLRNAIDIENLRDISADIKEANDDVVQGLWNRQHEGDMVDAARRGARHTSAHARKILASPLKSLSKIPQSYRANFADAREVYYETDNQVLASMKYAGVAVWAHVEGAYYLVIEAPIRFATHLVGTVIGVPGSLAIQAAKITLNVTVDAIGISLKITGHLINAVAHTAAAIITMAYSGISTGVAIAATTVASAAVASAHGVAWLVSAPVKGWNGTHVKLTISQDQLSLEEAVNLLTQDDTQTLSALGVELDDVLVKGNDFKKEIRFLKIFNNKLKVAAVIKIKRKSGQLEITGHLKNRLIKDIHARLHDDLTRRQVRRESKSNLLAVIMKKLNQEQ